MTAEIIRNDSDKRKRSPFHLVLVLAAISTLSLWPWDPSEVSSLPCGCFLTMKILACWTWEVRKILASWTWAETLDSIYTGDVSYVYGVKRAELLGRLSVLKMLAQWQRESRRSNCLLELLMLPQETRKIQTFWKVRLSYKPDKHRMVKSGKRYLVRQAEQRIHP